MSVELRFLVSSAVNGRWWQFTHWPEARCNPTAGSIRIDEVCSQPPWRITFLCEGHCPSWMLQLASLQSTHLVSVTASHCCLSSWDSGRVKSDSTSFDRFLFLDQKGNLTSNSRFSLKVVHGWCPPSHKVWEVGIPPHCWCSCLRNDCPIETCSLIWVCRSCRLALVLLVCLNQAHLAYLFNEASVSLSFLEKHMAWGMFVLVPFVCPIFSLNFAVVLSLPSWICWVLYFFGVCKGSF